jgi:MATE family multidrug resistance protein
MSHAAAQLDVIPARPDEHPLLELLRIAAPSVVTMTSYTAMQFVDAKMVAMITPADPVYVAAQGNGGLAAFVPISIMMGLLGVVNTYVSQNLGAGRPERGAAYGWNTLWLAAAGAILLLPYAAGVSRIFHSLGHEGAKLDLESRYARILLYGAVLTIATRGIAHYFYGMHKPAVVMAAAIVGNLVNVGANWVLIYGNFGAPALGVAGAALGTVVGTAVELSIPIAVFLSPPFDRRYRTRAAWRPSISHVRDLVRIGWPGALMFGSEMLCWGYFTVGLVGTFDTADSSVHNTSTWIALRYMHMAFMPAVGISFAMTALVGRYMGMRRPDLAAHRAWLGVAVTMTYMGACALLWVIFRQDLMRFFLDKTMDPRQAAEIVRVGSGVMIVGAVFQVFDALGITLLGALRGAGDTVWPGVMTVILSWACIVGGGHTMVAAAPELGSIGPWTGAAAYIILLGLFLLYRFVRGEWKSMDVLKDAAATAASH